MNIQELKQEIATRFHNFIYYLSHDKGWTWIDAIISSLAQLEVNLHLCPYKELRDKLLIADTQYSLGNDKWTEAPIKEIVPEDLLYCQDCVCRDFSRVAAFFYGDQMSGYCHYLAKGDFSFTNPTDLLWDGCKCCSINTDEEIEEYNSTNIEDLK